MHSRYNITLNCKNVLSLAIEIYFQVKKTLIPFKKLLLLTKGRVRAATGIRSYFMLAVCTSFAPCKEIRVKTALDSGFKAVDSGFQVLDFGCLWNLDSGFIPVVSSIQGIFLELNSGFQSPGFQIPKAKTSSIPEYYHTWGDIMIYSR